MEGEWRLILIQERNPRTDGPPDLQTRLGLYGGRLVMCIGHWVSKLKPEDIGYVTICSRQVFMRPMWWFIPEMVSRIETAVELDPQPRRVNSFRYNYTGNSGPARRFCASFPV